MNRLVTGYLPFLGQPSNPSQMIADQLTRELPDTHSIHLPVIYGKNFDTLRQHIESLPEFPDQVWILGQAAGRTQVTPERVAINWVESQYPDEAGLRPEPSFIIPGAPDAYIQNKWLLPPGIELDPKLFKISHSAGTFVCNHIYFCALHAWPKYRERILFVHVPLEQDMGLATQMSCLKTLIHAASS